MATVRSNSRKIVVFDTFCALHLFCLLPLIPKMLSILLFIFGSVWLAVDPLVSHNNENVVISWSRLISDHTQFYSLGVGSQNDAKK